MSGDESAVALGARWITLAFLVVGMLNYGYALLLTRLLDVADYSRFAAGQGLILWTSTVATVCVPWVLAHGLARARSDAEKFATVRFAKRVSTGSGVFAAVVVGAIATRFASQATAIVLAVSTLIIFLGTTTTGWLQGRERMGALSVLYLAENLLKNGTGVLLVMLGLGETGALAAFGIGGVVMLLRWPRTHRTAEQRQAGAADHGLWRHAAGIAGAQGLVSLFVAMDVVLVALLPDERALAASYQASATLSRVPLFIAGGVATAFFPSLSRGGVPAVLAARAMRMYMSVSVPLAALVITVPHAVLAVVFSAQYGAVATLLKFTAITGFGAGGITLITAFFQAADDYACTKWLSVGVAGYALGLWAGWWAGGITGLAAGGAFGTLFALLLVSYRLIRRQGSGVFARIPLAEPIVAATVLFGLRAYLVLWLLAATVVGVRAGLRFLRPGARHARPARWTLGAGRRHRDRGPCAHKKGNDVMNRRSVYRTHRNLAGTAERLTGNTVRRVVISSFDSPGNRHYNGGGVAVVEMITARLSGDFEVTVVTAGRSSGTEVRDGVRHVQLPVGWAGPRAGQLLFHALLPFAARRIRHDLWIENFTPPFSTSCLPLFTRAPVLGFAQALTGQELSVRYRLPFSVIERWGLRLYRDVVVLNPADLDLVRDSSPSATVRVIPNGIQRTTLDQRLLGRGEHILFLGRIDLWKKGLDILLAAYEMSGLAMPLLIAGSGLPREERKLAALLSATESNARWVGHVVGQQKQELLERSAFVVMPSRHETFGLVALEGMSCGKPVVHFDLPTLRWMGGDLRVPPYDVNALAAQMRQLADDEGKRRELGHRAHAVAQTYSRDETADRYFELVQELLGIPMAGLRART